MGKSLAFNPTSASNPDGTPSWIAEASRRAEIKRQTWTTLQASSSDTPATPETDPVPTGQTDPGNDPAGPPPAPAPAPASWVPALIIGGILYVILR